MVLTRSLSVTRFEVVVLALALLGPSAAAAARGKRTIKAHFGCTSEDEYLLSLANDSDV
jgi:hypothetical protein